MNISQFEEDIENAIVKPKVAYIIDPNNPLNVSYKYNNLETIFKLFNKYNITMILDSIFSSLMYNEDNTYIKNYVALSDKYGVPIIICDSFTKSLNFC